MDNFLDMRNGNRDAILAGFQSSSVLSRMNGAIHAAKQGLNDTEVKEALLVLKGDREACMGYRVSDIVIAVLDILDIEKYKGNDDRIRQMIQSKFDFF